MDITRLSILILMVVPVMLTMGLLVRIQDWRAPIAALQLRWEREQRQAGTSDVTLAQRQSAQLRFEELVSNRPMTRLWTHVALTIAFLGLGAALAWELNDLSWIAIWIIAPFGVISLAALIYCWIVIRSGQQQLAAISTTLYGPPPPRVKVRKLQVSEQP